MKAWWASLAQRERWLLGGGAGLVFLVLAWALIWDPLSKSRLALTERVAQQTRTLAWMQQAAAEVQRLRDTGAGRGPQRAGRSLLALADASAREAQLGNALKRVEPTGEKSVRVTLEGASFDALIGWMEGLASDFGVTATDFSAERVEGVGQVDARVTLVEP